MLSLITFCELPDLRGIPTLHGLTLYINAFSVNFVPVFRNVFLALNPSRIRRRTLLHLLQL
jgi:hypothetical protein